jgi:hypothetical protein
MGIGVCVGGVFRAVILRRRVGAGVGDDSASRASGYLSAASGGAVFFLFF